MVRAEDGISAEPTWLTLIEACKHLRISEEKLRSELRKGTGPVGYRVGGPKGHWRFRLADLWAWLDRYRVEPKGTPPVADSGSHRSVGDDADGDREAS